MSTQLCRNILIVRMGALGDIMHALPAQQQLSHQLPEASVHWLSEAAYVPLLQTVPGISQVWTANTKNWRQNPLKSGEMIHLFRDLRQQRFDVALDFQGLIKSAVLTRLSGAQEILGFAPERFKEKGIQWLYSKSQAGEGDLTRHIIETNLDLLRELIPVSKAQPVIPFSIPSSDREYVLNKLKERKARGPVLINPGAGWVTKIWPARNYARLAMEIERQFGASVVVTYGPGEEDLVEQIQNEVAPKKLAAFPTSIVQLAALCQASRLMIAGDSGPLHLAVAVGTPTVAILGPTSPERNGPFNPDDEVVKRNLPCSDSYKRVCNEFICMDIPVEKVFEAVERRLAKTQPKHLEAQIQ